MAPPISEKHFSTGCLSQSIIYPLWFPNRINFTFLCTCINESLQCISTAPIYTVLQPVGQPKKCKIPLKAQPQVCLVVDIQAALIRMCFSTIHSYVYDAKLIFFQWPQPMHNLGFKIVRKQRLAA